MALGKAIINEHGVCIRPIGKAPFRKNCNVMLVVELGSGREFKALGYTDVSVAEIALQSKQRIVQEFTEEQKMTLRKILK